LVQVTTCPDAEQFQPPPLLDTNPNPTGSVSVTVMGPVVGVLPTFQTVIAETPFTPTVTFPVCLLKIDSSITGTVLRPIQAGSEEELLAALASPVVATVAVLVTPGTAAAATLTVNVIEVLVLAASGPVLLQVTAWPIAEQAQPVPAPETKLRP